MVAGGVLLSESSLVKVNVPALMGLKLGSLKRSQSETIMALMPRVITTLR